MIDTLSTTVGVENLSQRGGVRELAETMVDTGSEFTWIPRPVLESLGIRPERRQRFIVADGRYVERDLGFAVHAGGVATADDVVFAEETDFVLLGWRSLGGLNLRVDAVRQLLVDAGPVLAVALTHS